MKTLLLASAFVTLASSPWFLERTAFAQQGKPVASVTEVTGACYVRDGAELQPKAIKAKDSLRADQEVLCNVGGRIKLRFESTSDTREVGARWLKVGNASVATPGAPNSDPVYKPSIGGRTASTKSDTVNAATASKDVPVAAKK